jgi:hypothetical protein
VNKQLKLDKKYKHPINKFPQGLKIIECAKEYKFADQLKNYDLVTY